MSRTDDADRNALCRADDVANDIRYGIVIVLRLRGDAKVTTPAGESSRLLSKACDACGAEWYRLNVLAIGMKTWVASRWMYEAQLPPGRDVAEDSQSE